MAILIAVNAAASSARAPQVAARNRDDNGASRYSIHQSLMIYRRKNGRQLNAFRGFDFGTDGETSHLISIKSFCPPVLPNNEMRLGAINVALLI